MRIQMTHHISGTRNGEPWPAPGGEIELPDDEALTVLRNRLGVAVETPAVPETAATKRKTTRRKTA